MTLPKDLLERPAIGRYSVLGGYRGSIAHGTFTPSTDPDSIDDKDAMFLCVPPPNHYLGLAQFGSRGTQEIVEGEWDIVVYEIRKAIALLLKGNPNVLSLLWLPENLYLPTASGAGKLLVERREVFSTRNVYHAYVGYARGQLSKMQRGAYRGYMGKKRRELVERYGYDAKNASHLIRLLRQGFEFLSTGEILVQRPDAQELLSIKRGSWSLEHVQREADRLFVRCEEAFANSKLPVRPNRVAADELSIEIVTNAWRDFGLTP